MDIVLDNMGDMYVSKNGDIRIENSVAQKIRIKLLWFEAEWRFDKEEGMPYKESLLIKNPDMDYFESVVREKIFEVEEVTEVREVVVTYDKKNRSACIRYTAMTDYETIKEEVNWNVGLWSDGKRVCSKKNGYHSGRNPQ